MRNLIRGQMKQYSDKNIPQVENTLLDRKRTASESA
jgi:hypothetical protein